MTSSKAMRAKYKRGGVAARNITWWVSFHSGSGCVCPRHSGKNLPFIPNNRRHHQVILTWLRIGHTNLSHTHLFGSSQQNCETWNVDWSINHWLPYFPMFRTIHYQLNLGSDVRVFSTGRNTPKDCWGFPVIVVGRTQFNSFAYMRSLPEYCVCSETSLIVMFLFQYLLSNICYLKNLLNT